MHHIMFLQLDLIYKSGVTNGTDDGFALIEFVAFHVTFKINLEGETFPTFFTEM